MKSGLSAITVFVLAFLLVTVAAAQGPKTPAPKTLFFDSDGNQVSNDEFVDIRMANFHIKDATRVKTLDDGTIEFHLQKVPQEGASAPSFTAKFLDGTPLNFDDLRGKVVVLNFWFVGCSACQAEIPKLNAFKSKFAGSNSVRFISMTDDTHSLVKRYLADNHFDYDVIADADSQLKQFVVGGYPKNIVIGKDGHIVYWRSTVVSWNKFEAVVRAELAK